MGVGLSFFFHCYFNRIESRFFFFILIFLLLSSSVFVNPNDSDSLEFALPMQVPLMAYGDR